MGQCPHRSVGRHAAKLVTGDERCLGAQVSGAERASTPAGPAPMTMTSNMCTRLLCLKVGEPAQAAVRKAIFTAPRDDKPWEALQAPANRPPWNCKAVALTVRPDDGISASPAPKKTPSLIH